MTINDYFKAADMFKLIMKDSLVMAASDLNRPSVDGAMCFPPEDCLDYPIKLIIPYEKFQYVQEEPADRALIIMDIPNHAIFKLIEKNLPRREELSLRTVLEQMPKEALTIAFRKFGRPEVAKQDPAIMEDLRKLSDMKKKVDQGGLKNE